MDNTLNKTQTLPAITLPEVAATRRMSNASSGETAGKGRDGNADKASNMGEKADLEKAIGGNGLKRHLESRHLQMIAIGGTIGTGLFIGGGTTIGVAGPGGALFAFGFVSIMVFFIVTSLGEMAAYWPVSGSFNTYAAKFVDPALAFTLGWNYWFQWAVSLPSELAAIGIIMQFWVTSVPGYYWSGSVLFVLLGINALGVRSFAETEYIFSLVKVLAVIVFVVMGFLVDFGVFGGEPILLKNFMIDGAPFKDGLNGIIQVFILAFFSFGGTELVGVTAGETKDPAKNVPKAIYGTFWRILIFYILTILVIGLCIPNTDPRLMLGHQSGHSLDVTVSPFTLVFEQVSQLKIAAHIMNGVILSAVLSAGNSAMYAASRTLMAMGQEGRAPAIFGRVDKRGTPWMALLATTLVGCISFLGIFVENGVVFDWLIRIAGISGILTWISISIIHLRFRRAFYLQSKPLSHLPYRAPFHPYGSYIAIFCGGFMFFGLVYVSAIAENPGKEFLSTFCGVPVFFGLYGYYKLRYKTQLVDLRLVDLDVGKDF